MDEKRMIDGLFTLEGLILPATPTSTRDEGRWAGSAESSDSARRGSDRKTTTSISYITPFQQEELGSSIVPAHSVAQLSGAQLAGPTLAFFLQLPATSRDSLSATVLHQPAVQSWQASPQLPVEPSGPTVLATERRVLRLSPENMAPADYQYTAAGDAASWDLSALRKAVLLLTFNSPAATLAALARLHAVALASQGRAALAALQPVPLVARVFANAVKASDHVSSERAATVLLALLSHAKLPLPEDVAYPVVVPAAVELLGGTAAAATAAAAAITATARAADAGGTLSSTALHVRLQAHPALTAPPPIIPPKSPGLAAAAPITCRLAAARLLLHLATSAPSLGAPSAATALNRGYGPGHHHSHGPGPGAMCDRLISAGVLEASCEALSTSVGDIATGALELQCCTLQLLAALTADVTGWPWQWPTVRAATVDGCARHALAMMQLLDGCISDGGLGLGGSGGSSLLGGVMKLEAEAHAAARIVVLQLSRGPLLVREALVRAGVLAPVVEAIMMWPPPPVCGAARSGSPLGLRLHFSLCLGVMLNLSSLPGVRTALTSAALGPLLGHLLGLMEHQPWESGAGGAQQGEPLVGLGMGAALSAADIRGTLLELLLNLALDPQCHEGLAAQGMEALLMRCISAGQQVRLGQGWTTESVDAAEKQLCCSSQQPHHQKPYNQPWRAVAALRLMAALAADSRLSVPRPATQLGLASEGAVEVVAHEVQSAAAALLTPGAAAAYDLVLTALCALMTGNGDLQRRVGGMPELLLALSVALSHPAVVRSDARLRKTLTAWRLITAPLAAPGADPTIARNLLLGLGQDPDASPAPAGGASSGGDGAAGLTGLLSSGGSRSLHELTGRPQSRQHRQSILLTAAELRARLSVGSEGGCSNIRASKDRRRSSEQVGQLGLTVDLEQGSGHPPEAVQAANRTLRASSILDKDTSSATPVTAGEVGSGAGGAPPAAALWTGPLLPGTPLPPPGAPPPSVAPLQPPSCVLAVLESRTPCSRGQAPDRLMRSPASTSQLNRPPSLTSAGALRSGSPAAPRRAVFTSTSNGSYGNGDGCQPEGSAAGAELLGNLLVTKGPGSHRLAAAPPISSVPVPSASQTAPLLLTPLDDVTSPQDLPLLPGALPPSFKDVEDNGNREGGSATGKYRSSAGTGTGPGASGAGEAATAASRGSDPRKVLDEVLPPLHPSAAVAPRPSSSGPTEDPRSASNSQTSSVRPAPAILQCSSSSSSARSVEAAAGAAAKLSGTGAKTELRPADAAPNEEAGSTVSLSEPETRPAVGAMNPALELAPPLLCLVTHLQALLGRPACRALGALVLVQLSRLDVVRSSEVMASSWGALMEAVTSSLTNSAAERSAAESEYQPVSTIGLSTGNSASAPIAPTDPRDKLALLEVMDVAAGSAVEGRAALTSPSVVSVLCDLSCAQGDLASSLLRRDDQVSQSGTVPPHHHHHMRPFRHFHHHHHHQSGGPQSTGQRSDSDSQLQLQLQQPYLMRGRTLAMEILGKLLELPLVAARLQETRSGARLAEQQLLVLASAAEAAEVAASSHAVDLGAAPGLVAEEQQRQRNAAARLLVRLADNVASARGYLALPGVINSLLDVLSQLWDTHAPRLVPPAAPLLPCTGLGAGRLGGSSRVSRGLGSTATAAATAAVEANGGTSESNLHLASRRSSNLLTDSHNRLANGNAPQPLSPACSQALAWPAGSDGVSAAMRRSATAGAMTGTGRGAAGLLPQATGALTPSLQQQRSQSPMLGTLRNGGGTLTCSGMAAVPGLVPHGVPTRMSLHAATCQETAQWTAPAQHAMKALELSEESQPAASSIGATTYRHAQTHTGSITPTRPSPLSAGSHPYRNDSGRGNSRFAAPDGCDDADADSEDILSRDDSFVMLKAFAPPPAKQSPPSAPPALEGALEGALPPQPRLRGAVHGHRSGRMSEVAFPSDVGSEDGGRGGCTAVGGIAAGGPRDAAGSEPEDSDVDDIMGNTVLRRGTRALAPPVASGPGLSAGGAAAPRSGAATSAAQCASDLLQLLRLLAVGDVDAARAMATLPAMELFVDLLASSSTSIVLAAMELLESLAERQDAHETFWDCDAVAQLVAHLQVRSTATTAAAAAAAAATPDRTPRPSGFQVIIGAGGVGSDAGGTAEEAVAAAAAAAASATASRLQLGAARVLQRLCSDPDLHGRLAATELPAALMAVVKRGADQGALQSHQGPLSSADKSMAPATNLPLLICALAALCCLLDCADVRRQARERRLPLPLGVLAGGGGGGDRLVAQTAARCGEKLREEPSRLRPISSASGLSLSSAAALALSAKP